MGDYTMIAFQAIIKPQYRKYVSTFMEGDWHNLADGERGLSVNRDFQEFIQDDRADFIPKGYSAYFSESDNEVSTAEQARPKYEVETGKWDVYCSLKNYDDTIEKFLKILPLIADEAFRIQYKFEYWDDSVYYILDAKDGKLHELAENDEISKMTVG